VPLSVPQPADIGASSRPLLRDLSLVRAADCLYDSASASRALPYTAEVDENIAARSPPLSVTRCINLLT